MIILNQNLQYDVRLEKDTRINYLFITAANRFESTLLLQLSSQLRCPFSLIIVINDTGIHGTLRTHYSGSVDNEDTGTKMKSKLRNKSRRLSGCFVLFVYFFITADSGADMKWVACCFRACSFRLYIPTRQHHLSACVLVTRFCRSTVRMLLGGTRTRFSKC